MAERWTRIWCVLPVSSRTRSIVCSTDSSSFSKRVTASLPTPAAISVGLSGSRPTGASTVPVSGTRTPPPASQQPRGGRLASDRSFPRPRLGQPHPDDDGPVDPADLPARHHADEPRGGGLGADEEHQRPC